VILADDAPAVLHGDRQARREALAAHGADDLDLALKRRDAGREICPDRGAGITRVFDVRFQDGVIAGDHGVREHVGRAAESAAVRSRRARKPR
jgi:hypothetical protein